MNGGTISNNTGTNNSSAATGDSYAAGGVYLSGTANLVKTGGTINGNTAGGTAANTFYKGNSVLQYGGNKINTDLTGPFDTTGSPTWE
jgi:hypothetical protein